MTPAASSTTWALPSSPSAAARRSRRTATTAPTWRSSPPPSRTTCGRNATADEANAAFAVGRWAGARVREGIEASLERLGVHFDVWTTETSIHEGGWVERGIERLREHGYLFEQDGALWFRATDFGDDKDRVIIKSNGSPTYFAADIGYVTEKLSRGFDHLIYVWGADHHGTIARVRGAAEAMGFDPGRVQILLYSWVRFVRDGVEISMSKRSGEFITLDELLTEVGVDAARWFFASRGHTSAIDFDIELRLLVVAVVPGDTAAEHLDREVSEARVGRKQAEGLVEALVRGDQLGRRLLVVELLHLRGELRLIERLAGHLARSAAGRGARPPPARSRRRSDRLPWVRCSAPRTGPRTGTGLAAALGGGAVGDGSGDGVGLAELQAATSTATRRTVARTVRRS